MRDSMGCRQSSGDFELTMDELRAVVRYAVACAEPSLVLFEKASPDDPRPAAALEAARVFAEGAARSRLQRTAAVDAHRAGEGGADRGRPARGATQPAMPRRRPTCIPWRRRPRCATSWARPPTPPGRPSWPRGDDPVVAEYVITAAAKRATPTVHDVLSRYPRAPGGRSRVAVLIQRLDSLLRDPPPTPRVVDDPGPFFHGTRADLRPGDLLTPGWRSNYGSGRSANHIYLTATREGAPLAAELARGEGPGRVYRVEPLGTIEDDPNVTDKRFPGNPTRSYRTTEPVRVVEEILDWTPPSPELIRGAARAYGRTGRTRHRGDGRLTRPVAACGRCRRHHNTSHGMAA